MLVIGCIEAKFRNKICVGMRWKALAEIYTMHSFEPFWNRSQSSNFCLKIAENFANFANILPNFAEFR